LGSIFKLIEGALTIAGAASSLALYVFHFVALSTRPLSRGLLLNILNYLLSCEATGTAAMLSSAGRCCSFFAAATATGVLLLCFRCLHRCCVLKLV